MIKDEYIPHGNPVTHHDFFYAAVKFDVSDQLLCDVNLISESMYYDRLTNHLIARCHAEGPNIASLLLGVKVANGSLTLDEIRTNDLYKKYITDSNDRNLMNNMYIDLCNSLNSGTNYVAR